MCGVTECRPLTHSPHCLLPNIKLRKERAAQFIAWLRCLQPATCNLKQETRLESNIIKEVDSTRPLIVAWDAYWDAMLSTSPQSKKGQCAWQCGCVCVLRSVVLRCDSVDGPRACQPSIVPSQPCIALH